MRKEAQIEVANKLIDLMESAGSDWIKPWTGSAVVGGMRNARTNRPYRGVNVFLTNLAAAANGWDSPYWNTYKGWKEQGYQVAKGSKATEIVFWKILVKDEAGVEKKIPFARMYNVFNADQLTEPFERPTGEAIVSEFEAHQDANLVIETWSGTQCPITHGGDRAFYMPSADAIMVPHWNDFTSSEAYYGTVMHEIVHATGHKNRLDRKLTGSFGDPDYAFEELIAELGAALICVGLGVTPEPRADHAQYLNGWIKGLKDDPKVIWRAFSHAQRAVDYILKEDEDEAISAGEAA